MTSRRIETKLDSFFSAVWDAAQHAPRLFGVAPARVSLFGSSKTLCLVLIYPGPAN